MSIIGLTRIRNESRIILDTLNHMSEFCDDIVVYDDASTDDTVKICKSHPKVIEVVESKDWNLNRAQAEYQNRQILLEAGQRHANQNDWFVYMDADERIDFEFEHLDRYDAIRMKLFDVYITPSDAESHYTERNMIGPEYREIIMAFKNKPGIKYHMLDQREVTLTSDAKILCGGYVKHFGKGISIEQWEETCEYYAKSFPMYSDKWNLRRGRAVHTTSDFGNALIHWDKRDEGFPLTKEIQMNDINKPLNILITNYSMYRLGGTETYVYTLVKELKKRGHNVEIWTKEPGTISNLINIEFGCAINQVKQKYDLILINHNFMAKRVLELGLEGVKIQTCHGVYVDLEQPFPGLDGYVSISQEVQDHLTTKGFKSTVIHNGIDCDLFRPRGNASKSVYSLSQNDALNQRLKRICNRIGYEFNSNNKFQNPTFDTHKEINKASVVVSLGRGAYEAMACGKPVIVLDHRPYSQCYADGLLTNQNLEESMKHNCSGRRYNIEPTDDEITQWILGAHPNIGREMRLAALNKFNIEHQVTKYIQMFNQLDIKSGAIIHDEHPEVFGNVSKMLKELYENNSKYSNSIIWIGYNLRKISQIKQQYPGKKIIIYQMEQLFNGSPYSNKLITDNLKQADEIWDYDEENIRWIKNTLSIDAIFHPLLFTESLKTIPQKSFDEHDIDVLFYGYPNDRRSKVLEEFCKQLWRSNISVVTLFNCYGDKLDDFISRSKIIINIHFFDTSRQEQARLFHLLINGKCILSETSPKNYLEPCVHEESTRHLARKCQELITSRRWWNDAQNNSRIFKEKSVEIKSSLITLQ